MKRIICMITCVCLICCILFTGCKKEEEPIVPLNYYSAVLIQKELPDENLVWAGTLQAPEPNVFMNLGSPEYKLFGMVSPSHIDTVPTSQQAHYLTELDSDALSAMMGWSEEEYSTHIRTAIQGKNRIYYQNEQYFVWEDVVLFHFYVNSVTYKNRPVTYADKYLFCAYETATGESHILALTEEEYQSFGKNTSTYHGRIGDRCYFSEGYYDLSTHSYTRYQSQSMLPEYISPEIAEPPTENQFVKYSLARILQADSRIQPYRKTSQVMVPTVYQLGNRLYGLLVTGERCYDETEDGEKVYDGSQLWLIMADAQTLDLLYVEVFDMQNYWASNLYFGLYYKTEDGKLFDPMLP